MDTLSLMDVLKKLNKKFANRFHVGVYAANTLPKKCRKPAAVIMNNQNSSMPGEHWSAAFLPVRGKAEYFCSYGLQPNLVAAHEKFLLRNAKAYIYNKKQLQQLETQECGRFCLLYLANKMDGRTMNQFLTNFDSSFKINDLHTNVLGRFLLRELK
jgi:hypothetical protein